MTRNAPAATRSARSPRRRSRGCRNTRLLVSLAPQLPRDAVSKWICQPAISLLADCRTDLAGQREVCFQIWPSAPVPPPAAGSKNAGISLIPRAALSITSYRQPRLISPRGGGIRRMPPRRYRRRRRRWHGETVALSSRRLLRSAALENDIPNPRYEDRG